MPPPSPPPPTFTPSSLIDLSTKTYILTFPSLSLARTLYSLHSTLYLPASLIPLVRASCSSSKGTLHPLSTPTTSSSPDTVTACQSHPHRLDVLFLSAAASDLEASFHLATIFVTLLRTTASHFCHANPSVRIIWIATTSSSAETAFLLAHEFAAREHAEGRNPFGVQHVVVNAVVPGSKVLRTVGRWVRGGRMEELEACTLLYAGFAPGVRSGDWVVPWGRKGAVPESVREGMVRKGGGEKSGSVVLYGQYYERMRKFM